MPASSAAPAPTHGLWLLKAAAKPASAPASIMPSMPTLMTPGFLRQRLAQRRQQQRDGKADAGEQQADENDAPGRSSAWRVRNPCACAPLPPDDALRRLPILPGFCAAAPSRPSISRLRWPACPARSWPELPRAGRGASERVRSATRDQQVVAQGKLLFRRRQLVPGLIGQPIQPFHPHRVRACLMPRPQICGQAFGVNRDGGGSIGI